MAARGDGVEGDERVWVVVVGRGEPGWRLSMEGEFSCELELGAAMVAAVRLGCASRELCVGKKNKGEGKEEWDALARQGRPGSSGSGRGARPDAAVVERPSERGVRGQSGASATARARRVLEWGGDGARQGSSGAASTCGSGAASGRQRCSERERAHSSAMRARRQRREEEGGERKGTLVNDFDSIQNKNFLLKLEKL